MKANMHTISFWTNGDLALYALTDDGARLVDIVSVKWWPAAYRRWRMRRRLAASFAMHDVTVLRVEGDARHDHEVYTTIRAAIREAATRNGIHVSCYSSRKAQP